VSADGIDFAELLRSPLEPEDEDRVRRGPWWPVVAALIAGALVGWLAVAGGDGGAEPASDREGPVPTTATTQAVAAAAPFPADYAQIAPEVAVRPEAPVRIGDRLLVPFTTVVKRDANPAEVARPLGGRWELTGDGGVVASAGTVYDPLRPSVFSVVFPVPVAFPESIELVERWDPEPVTASVELPFTGLPYVTGEPIVLDLGDGVALVITRLDLGNFQGRARWTLDGSPLGIVSLGVRLFNPDGSVLGDYEPGEAESLDPQRGRGFIDYLWGPGFGVDQNAAATFTVTADVQLGVPATTNVPIPLTD
jgi:hypothetical protein